MQEHLLSIFCSILMTLRKYITVQQSSSHSLNSLCTIEYRSHLLLLWDLSISTHGCSDFMRFSSDTNIRNLLSCYVSYNNKYDSCTCFIKFSLCDSDYRCVAHFKNDLFISSSVFFGIFRAACNNKRQTVNLK